ncbi:uncharacterized protein LOC111327126 [Stylophora pistillata]|uniref:uncharacterized protein LOC111327126 n=1 Tax=Stylophora pistillata TaxID=50429 RepID=UPI000C056507|nr:uncharacterized protein LOC111327126 [Stylophora pistillata]
MGNKIWCCRTGDNGEERPILSPSLKTKRNIPYLQTRRPIRGESPEPSSESDLSVTSNSTIMQIPGRPSTLRVDKETGGSSSEDSLEFSSEDTFCPSISYTSEIWKTPETFNAPSESEVQREQKPHCGSALNDNLFAAKS